MSILRVVRPFSLAVAVSLVLSSCGSGTGDKPKDLGDVVVDGKVNLPALQQVVDTQRARSEEQQEAELARLDSALERRLWTMSGLESALGGKAAADAAFAAHGEAISDKARAVGAAPVEFTPAVFMADSGPGIGEGMFGGYMVVALGAKGVVSATNDAKDGEHGEAQVSKEVKMSGSRENADLEMNVTHESDGVTSTMSAKVSVNPCPDAKGHFKAEAKIDVSATKTGSNTGQKGTMDVTITGEVDDDANLKSSDAEWRMQWADFANSRGGFVDINGAVGDTKIRDASFSRVGGKPTVELQTSAVVLGTLYALLIKSEVSKAAEQGWQSGRCVTLKPTVSSGPKKLKPGASSTITAAPRSRIDGGPVGGTVKATLSAGGAGVKPDGSKVKADATFVYTAPDAENKTGTVSLEARSRRGVAKASIDFDTKQGAYVASGGTEVKVSGTVEDLALPFSVKGKGAGFTVVYSYTPTSATGGTVSYKGSGAGVTMKGSGTYKITGDDPVLTLKQTVKGCVNVGGCRTTTNVYSLTRAAS